MIGAKITEANDKLQATLKEISTLANDVRNLRLAWEYGEAKEEPPEDHERTAASLWQAMRKWGEACTRLSDTIGEPMLSILGAGIEGLDGRPL